MQHSLRCIACVISAPTSRIYDTTSETALLKDEVASGLDQSKSNEILPDQSRFSFG